MCLSKKININLQTIKLLKDHHSKIESESQVNKLSFIDIYNFALQLENEQVIEIFYNNEGSYDCFNFPCFILNQNNYYQPKKSGQILNVFQIENKDFINQQKITFRTNIFYGDVSKDTNYLALWDQQTYLIQVWELQQ